MKPEEIPDLEVRLKALANRNRLFLLSLLQTPHRVSEMVVRATRPSAWGGPKRPLTRQTIQSHLKRLQEIGIVTRIEDDAEGRYTVHPSALFDLTQQLQQLASVRTERPIDEATRAAPGSITLPGAGTPHLVVVRGLNEGSIHVIDRKGVDGAWTLGRGRDQDLCLEHDRLVSGHHASIHVVNEGFILADTRTSRNGTSVNYQRLPSGGMVPLATGDLIEVGRSMFLFRGG